MKYSVQSTVSAGHLLSSWLSILVSGWGVGQARVGADSLCLSVFSGVCVCLWWGKGDSQGFPGACIYGDLGWSWVQALAPAFQRELRSMVIRHLPPQANGEGVCFSWTPTCRDENQEDTAGFTCHPSSGFLRPLVRRWCCSERLSQMPLAVDLSILVSFS